MEKTCLVSHILKAQRKTLKNELIACFGHTAVITNNEEITDLKRAQQTRNSDVYRTSIQYTVLDKIHCKEGFLVPHQDAILLLQDNLEKNLRKILKTHNGVEGLGRLANHTCCDVHWNANLEVTAIVLPKTPQESMQVHDAVAAALSPRPLA